MALGGLFGRVRGNDVTSGSIRNSFFITDNNIVGDGVGGAADSVHDDSVTYVQISIVVIAAAGNCIAANSVIRCAVNHNNAVLRIIFDYVVGDF